jgi:hypothetical protein
VVADFAEKLRLPVKLVQCSQEYYSYKAVSCLSFVVDWRFGPVRYRLCSDITTLSATCFCLFYRCFV